MARPARLGLATLYLEDKSRCAISLIRLGSAYFQQHRFVWYSGVIGPKLELPEGIWMAMAPRREPSCENLRRTEQARGRRQENVGVVEAAGEVSIRRVQETKIASVSEMIFQKVPVIELL